MKKFLIITILGVSILSGCGIGTYQGQTAEEWFNDYDYMEAQYDRLIACVEDYRDEAYRQCL